ncbi:MAG: M56 family metallopeptidase, partial [Pirellulales bacterium]|nr:M56 family metallopeptidase [Pirellulales bacterium]
MPSEMLEAVLAHELAHIRRYDYLINLLQTVIETLLFHHPGVWWISRRIRAERVCCCDDLALSVTMRRAEYAQALAAVAELQVSSSNLAVAANSGSLLDRLRRVAGVENAHAARRGTWLAAALVLLSIVAIVPLALAMTPPRSTPLWDTVHGYTRTPVTHNDARDFLLALIKEEDWVLLDDRREEMDAMGRSSIEFQVSSGERITVGFFAEHGRDLRILVNHGARSAAASATMVAYQDFIRAANSEFLPDRLRGYQEPVVARRRHSEATVVPAFGFIRAGLDKNETWAAISGLMHHEGWRQTVAWGSRIEDDLSHQSVTIENESGDRFEIREVCEKSRDVVMFIRPIGSTPSGPDEVTRQLFQQMVNLELLDQDDVEWIDGKLTEDQYEQLLGQQGSLSRLLAEWTQESNRPGNAQAAGGFNEFLLIDTETLVAQIERDGQPVPGKIVPLPAGFRWRILRLTPARNTLATAEPLAARQRFQRRGHRDDSLRDHAEIILVVARSSRDSFDFSFGTGGRGSSHPSGERIKVGFRVQPDQPQRQSMVVSQQQWRTLVPDLARAEFGSQVGSLVAQVIRSQNLPFMTDTRLTEIRDDFAAFVETHPANDLSQDRERAILAAISRHGAMHLGLSGAP